MHVDLPSSRDIQFLLDHKADNCVSIYMPTSPLPSDDDIERITFKDICKQVLNELQSRGADKATIELFEEQFGDHDEDFWMWDHQANTLAFFTDGSVLRVYHLANKLEQTVKVADRFLVKPLLRAITFPQAAYVLALAEGSVRVFEIGADFGPFDVVVPHLPDDAASAAGKASIDGRTAHGRIQGSEGKKVRVRQYAKKVDRAVRHTLLATDLPIILAAAEPTASIYREVNTLPQLSDHGVEGSPEKVNDLDLVPGARKALDAVYADEIAEIRSLYSTRTGENRTVSDLSDLARAATDGQIHTLYVDIDSIVRGTVDDAGFLTFDDGPDSYDVIDEIARRVLAADGAVLALREEEMPAGPDAAAVLRWA